MDTAGDRDEADLAVIIVAYDHDERWLQPCLETLFAHLGDISVDVMLVDNNRNRAVHEVVNAGFPQVRVIECENRGFAHANNRAAITCTARYVLFLNPDTEILDGTLAGLVAKLDRHLDIGLAGVKQVTAGGELFPTIRRFPNGLRALSDALTSEEWRWRPSWLGERELDWSAYEREQDCDWTSGSFMLARREALLSAGLLDERFFIFSEEPDLCLRLKRAGWRTIHTPALTILHHANKSGVSPRILAQDAFARRQYAAKHFGPVHRRAYLAAVGVGHALHALRIRGQESTAHQAAARRALATLAGRTAPPFGPPPPTAIAACPPADARSTSRPELTTIG
jgi:N-acetylglucosaminyl-diphospho-decaprenol L-rhamnosyltransferase